MIELSKDAPGEAACGYSGRPLVALCPCGRRRFIVFRRLKTDFGDRTPLYSRPFKCPGCGSIEVALFALESQAEMDTLRPEMLPPETSTGGEVRRIGIRADTAPQHL
ncbi:MAG: hypothetical protein JWR80_489 [Bradyrhizobium sp.]|nr:hypothetical protein [Bradyrhizobium sp.]